MKKSNFIYILLLFIVGCSRYFELIPISYEGNLDSEINQEKIFLYFDSDTVRISASTTYYNLDSTLDAFIYLHVKNEDDKWYDEYSFFLTDDKKFKLFPYSIGNRKVGNSTDSLDYRYSIMFHPGDFIKYPINFHIVGLDNREHIITFIPKRIEDIE
ncbi:MAG: hypothetical protein HND52_10000 [Ignavibacteriae bacterium]|nr:hypothetical protein [Ignavibacteriota bacterium]NOG98280.1 hypothetical protein [Ignavibacteriota bacterium]